ncbi:M56 family metallopeptidase [Paludisphaera soli]|uniref:M56 family metallopeptidase n=1 Tax=Paludisphaera soli TaxID=2712865 RepID=UPI0013ECECFE|nr:M56 family metallopeptidase [Paludisphaera soli]
MTTDAGRLAYWLADYYALATGLLLATVPILLAMGQPARRLVACRCAFAGLLALLVLVSLPGWPRVGLGRDGRREAAATIAAVDPAPRTAPTPRPAEAAGRPAAVALAAPAPLTPARPIAGIPDRPIAASPPSLAAIVVGAFLAGSGLMLAWLAIGSWRLAVVRRGSRPAPAGVEALLAEVSEGAEPPALLVSDALRQPVAAGLLRPTILLPSRFLDEPEARLRAALAHEWAHVRHGDLGLIALSRFLLPALYAHPLYWWLRRRVRLDQEMLADASAAGSSGRLAYAEALLAWSRGEPERLWGAAGGSVALFERPSQIKRRIAMLIDGKTRFETTCPARWRLAARLVTASAVAAASLLTLRPIAVADDPAPQVPAKIQPGAGVEARVLDPDGRPMIGAKVYATTPFHGAPPVAPAPIGDSGPDGSIRLPDPNAEIVATAEGLGPGFVDRPVSGEMLLKLVRDDVPIWGRVVDAQGRPVVGASVRVHAIAWNPSGDLDRLIAAFRPTQAVTTVTTVTPLGSGESGPGPAAAPPLELSPGPQAADAPRHWRSDLSRTPIVPPAVADRDGRFTLRGVGRERLVTLRIAGEGIETTSVQVATREMPTVENLLVPGRTDGPKEIYRGATFEYAAPPGREVVGTITDVDTGEPVPGATVWPVRQSTLMDYDMEAVTDAQGRYRLVGLPAQDRPFTPGVDAVGAARMAGAPYLWGTTPIGEGDRSKPTVVDLQLRRGVRVKGRVVDKETGRGVRSIVSYFVLAGNPYMTQEATSRSSHPGGPTTDDDGNFELIARLGPGALAAQVHGKRFVYDGEGMPYRRGAGVDAIPGLKWKNVQSGLVDTLTDWFRPYDYQAVAGIDPKPGEAEATCTLFVERSPTVKGRVVGPDGEPLAGAVILGARDYLLAGSGEPEASAEFVVEKLVPNAPRNVTAFLPEKKLIGTVKVAFGEAGPVVLKLEQHGQVAGRLVDAEGRPVPNWEIEPATLWISGRPDEVPRPGQLKTGPDGRFRMEGLIPGRKYTFHVWKPDPSMKQYPQARRVALVKDLVIASGETHDVGDVNHDGPGID